MADTNRVCVFAALLAGVLGPALGAAAQPIAHDCVLWLRSDTGVTTSGSQVTGVTDGSGAGHHASNTSGGGPALVPNAINGHPVMRFAGGQWLNLTGQVLTSQTYTIIAVVTDTRGDAGFHEVFSNWNTTNQGTSVFFGTTAFNPSGTDTTRARLTDDVGGANQGQTGVGVVTTRSSPFIFTGVSRAANAAVYQNRTLIAQSNAAISTRVLLPPYVIGRQGPISEFWTGDIAEILVYNAALSDCELDALDDYFTGRYGLAPCKPTINSGPAPQSTCSGGEASFACSATGGVCAQNLAYRWSRGGTPVDDDGRLVGTHAATLTIHNVQPGDAGSYTCAVTNQCDGFPDIFDFNDFVACFEDGLCPPGKSADFNNDGFADIFDFTDFVDAFEQGC